MIQSFIDTIKDSFSWVTDYVYLAEWYVLGGIAIAILLVIAWFAGMLPILGRWIRALTGMLILVIIAFLAGIVVAFQHFKDTLAELRKKKHEDSGGWWK